MASWREIDRIRKAPAEFRAVAKRLLKLDAELTEWESIFVEKICNDTETKEFTTRQSEKLLQIRDDYETITKYRGYSVETLLDKCWLARLDLSESQEQKLQKLRERSRMSVRLKDIAFLMRCARELEIIEDEYVGHGEAA
jgi:hypothetical protein